MSALAAALILAALIVAYSIAAAEKRHTREVRAIAEEQADERRQVGLAANVVAFNSLGRSANR